MEPRSLWLDVRTNNLFNQKISRLARKRVHKITKKEDFCLYFNLSSLLVLLQKSLQ